jgi:magnesium transporter
VVFVPINIIAGIGGMSEFSMMTREIPWPLAYGGFVAAMGVIGLATYRFLRWTESRQRGGMDGAGGHS